MPRCSLPISKRSKPISGRGTDMPRSNSPFSRAFSRRVMLKGAGCSMALPWLESVNALADTPSPSGFPKRVGVVVLGGGVNENHWSAEGSGADINVSKRLQPLEPLKQKVNLIDGLVVRT